MDKNAAWVLGILSIVLVIPAIADSHRTPGGIVKPEAGKRMGKLTVRFELFDSRRGGCTTLSGHPSVRVDGTLVSPGPPNLGRVYSTGNTLSSGYQLEISPIPAGRHEVSVSVAGGCGGFGWQPSARQRVNLIEGNRYTGVVKFTYNRVFSVQPPKVPIKPSLQ